MEAELNYGTFEVSAKWMKTCGMGDEPKVFKVVGVQPAMAPNDFFSVMYHLEGGWVAAAGRGTFRPA